MVGGVRRVLRRWRENYYLSLFLTTITRPLYLGCSNLASQIQMKVRRNGASIRLSNGRTMRIARNSGITLASTLFWHGLEGYERATSETLRFFFTRSATFIDVGANYGFYSMLAAFWNPSIQVVAFEPLLPIYEGLRKNIALNQLNDRVVCENMALSNQTTSATLYVPDAEGKDCEATGTLATNSWQVRQGAPGHVVETIQFDDYEARHPMKVDLIKIDVEDFEADVLAGMPRIIKRDRPFIVCEILPRNKEHRNERTRQVVESFNYVPYWITPSGYIRVSRFDFERTDDRDFLLSPVSIPGEILTDLNLLWEQRQKSGAYRSNRVLP
jgi:FkbM family methyltransferase